MPKNIFCDIDNTICITNGSDYEHSKPILARIDAINDLYNDGHHITYWTARGGRSGIDWTDLTVEQLRKWGAKYHELKMGGKPDFDLYICDKSINSESYFNPHIEPDGMSHK